MWAYIELGSRAEQDARLGIMRSLVTPGMGTRRALQRGTTSSAVATNGPSRVWLDGVVRWP